MLAYDECPGIRLKCRLPTADCRPACHLPSAYCLSHHTPTQIVPAIFFMALTAESAAR
jgi:hypothetical protein